MANRHYNLDEEIEVTVKVKVKNIHISNYQHLSEEQQQGALKDFKQEISDHLMHKLVGSCGHEEVTEWIDWWYYDIEEAD